MAEQKTKKTNASVQEFLNKVADVQQREDAFAILKMMQTISGHKPKMWGPSIVGFGEYHYKYESGHEGDCCQIGFSPRKGNLALYFMPGLACFEAHLKKLGKHKTGKSCLYIKRLADVDEAVLREMIEVGFSKMVEITQRYQDAASTQKTKKKT